MLCVSSLAECTLEASKRDVQSQEETAQEEDAVVQEASLQESHEQVQDMIRMERSELSLIGEQCVKDINSISETVCTCTVERPRPLPNLACLYYKSVVILCR